MQHASAFEPSGAGERTGMELYYKDLISEEASLEKLVDDLMRVVQGADALVEAAGAKLAPERRAEIATRLGRLKESCRRVKRQAIRSALATDKLVHRYPYSFLGFAFALGLLTAALVNRKG
jgi:ElaB/YqjD/DUF883 family membrane-anchored ribosome-binding protein